MSLVTLLISFCSEPVGEICNRNAESSSRTDWLTIIVNNLKSFQESFFSFVFSTFSRIFCHNFRSFWKKVLRIYIYYIYIYICCAELCGCTACDGNRDILHGSRFTMLSGLLSSITVNLQQIYTKLIINSEWPYSLEKMRTKKKTRFLTDTDSSILCLLREQCTLQCYLLVGIFIIPWKGKFSWEQTLFIFLK